ncbi:Kiwa anti-phage protein KwaB-like domain-containing protein [Flavobacterium terrigena]|uniref:DUF4868 domain-containing protein n=1 Tax=Flavobacterium terrigena TaxID=402734 RepID=A0A1H6S7T0_9FLAO|nr:Kiwa anti-phage protein KwaB-like domain-containing protein [Flavobacterium terrigena]SEI62826.1 protein of unknown function [Flavobacterium terrigena]
MTNNFFAILTDGTVRKILLTQVLTPTIRTVFINYGIYLLNDDTEQIEFTGNYKLDDEEILFIKMDLPESLNDVATNSIGIPNLNLEIDNIKTLFWFEGDKYYFQNFDSRKLLSNKNVLFYSNNTYSKLESDAFVVDNIVNAIYENGNFYFRSYANANKIFSLIEYFEEATNDEIIAFVGNDKVSVDQQWLIDNSNTLIRKHITLLQKSNVLSTANTKKIKTSANRFNLKIELDGTGRIVFPTDKKSCKDILTFLNEQFYIGLISGNKYRTNSKRTA